MKLFRNTICLFSLLALFVFLLPISSHAAEGTCGEGISWTLEGGTLTISGVGTMKIEYDDNAYEYRAPWYGLRNNITKVVVQDGITHIDRNAFRNCTNLSEVALPSGLVSIGSGAFSGCSSLTAIHIPASLTSISSCAFSGCTGMRELHIDSISSWCNVLLADSPAHPLIDSAGGALYLSGRPVTNLAIPKGITVIKSDTFRNCANLVNVSIPEGVTHIGFSAFNNCTNLISVSMPSTLRQVESSAFSACTNLRILRFNGSQAELDQVVFDGTNAKTLNRAIVFVKLSPKEAIRSSWINAGITLLVQGTVIFLVLYFRRRRRGY